MLRVMLVIDDYNELIYLQTLLKKLGFDVEGLQNPRRYADLSLGFNPHILVTTAKGRKVDGLQLALSITKRRGLPKIMALKLNEQKLSQTELNDAGIDVVVDSPINVRKFILALSQLGDLDETALIEKFNKIKGSLAEVAQNDHGVHYTSVDEHGEPVTRIKDIQTTMETIISGKTKGSETSATSEKVFLPGERPTTSKNEVSMNTESDPDVENLDDIANKTIQNMTDQGGIGEGDSSLAMGPEFLKEFDHKAMQGRFDSWLKKLDDPGEGHFDRKRILDFNKKIRSTANAEDIEEIEDERKKFVRALFNKK